MCNYLTQSSCFSALPHISSGNCIIKTQTFEGGESLSNITLSRSAKSLLIAMTKDSIWRNACRVSNSRLILTLLPLKFYSKWPCWFPVEINFALLLSKPNSHSAASSPSLDRWHQCTSIPNLGNRPGWGKRTAVKIGLSFKYFHFQLLRQFLFIIWSTP